MTEEQNKEFEMNDPITLLSLLASSAWGPGEASKSTSRPRKAWDECIRSELTRDLILVLIAPVEGYILSVRNNTGGVILGVVAAAVLSGLILVLSFVAHYLNPFFKRPAHG
jgi:hypothetical protein